MLTKTKKEAPSEELVMEVLTRLTEEKEKGGHMSWLGVGFITHNMGLNWHKSYDLVGRVLDRMAKEGKVLKWDWKANPSGPYPYAPSRSRYYGLPDRAKSDRDLMRERAVPIESNVWVMIPGEKWPLRVIDGTDEDGRVTVLVPMARSYYSGAVKVISDEEAAAMQQAAIDRVLGR